MVTPTEERKLAAIMFTDMVGYSALAQRDDKVALELLEEHRRLLRELFPPFHGTEIKTIGDAFLVNSEARWKRPSAPSKSSARWPNEITTSRPTGASSLKSVSTLAMWCIATATFTATA